MSDTRRLAYQIILSRAVEFANQDGRKPSYLGGEIFHLPNAFDHLELRFDPDLVRYAIVAAQQNYGEIRSDDEIYGVLTKIVRDSIVSAINSDQECAEAFGALVVDNARTQAPLEDWF